MDLVSRLKRYLDYRQISVTQFADECAIPRPTGSQLLAGRNKKVSDEIIGKIHSAYPELNISWLMFGEGDMVKSRNIEISEPQNAEKSEGLSTQQPEQQDIDFAVDFGENIPDNLQNRNSQPSPAVNTFTFATTSESSTSDPAFDINNEASIDAKSITVKPDKGKRVTGIVVYYDDCTYESFIPDPNHGHPFMR